MKDIEEVLRRKRAQFEQLRKQIELLQEASDKLRAVAPLLTECESDEDGTVLTEVEEDRKAAAAGAAGQPTPAPTNPGRSTIPRWP
jgi:prefoldin subunit 5